MLLVHTKKILKIIVYIDKKKTDTSKYIET